MAARAMVNVRPIWLSLPIVAVMAKISMAQRPAKYETSVAFAKHSAFETRFGQRKRTFGYVALRRPFSLTAGGHLSFFGELAPIAISTGMPVGIDSVPCTTGSLEECWVKTPRLRTAYGVGLSPLGIKVETPVAGRVALTLDGSVGALIFSSPVPDHDARRFNAALAAGAGIAVMLTTRSSMAVTYQLHHTSNGGTANANPGMDSRMVRFAYRWRK
jgi:hypothetical protein